MIPFLVADRPISLSIIKGISLPSVAKIGILTLATSTSARFKQVFSEYPQSVDVVYRNGHPSDEQIAKQTIKMVDSGIFGKNGCQMTHRELFENYEAMGADYGVMIDAFRDAETTVVNARDAVEKHKRGKCKFRLVGVAQGKTPEEFFRCYENLQKIGISHIAVGGLLKKRKGTARYVNVRSERLMEKILLGIRQRFDPDWLFALGAFHPSRLDLFQEAGVWGSDYKGWIFNYAKKDEVVELIQSGSLESRSRVALKTLRMSDVRNLDEQELRFMLTRGGIERRVMDAVYGRRLLVIACSNRKLPINTHSAKAWEVYDGVVFRLLKKLKREKKFPADVDIYILSARYGLIGTGKRIVRYDQKMTKSRAVELAPGVSLSLKQIVLNERYREVYLCLGQTYLHAVNPLEKWVTDAFSVKIAEGRIGEKLQATKRWLVGSELERGSK